MTRTVHRFDGNAHELVLTFGAALFVIAFVAPGVAEPDDQKWRVRWRRDGRRGAVEVAQEVLAETQEAVLPLVPYLDTLRGVFITAALAGIAVAIYARIDDWQKGRR